MPGYAFKTETGMLPSKQREKCEFGPGLEHFS